MRNSIENIVNILNAKRIGTRPTEIDWILTDSRSLCFAEETLFFALKSKRNDGHKYIPELYERGVRSFVVGELPQNIEEYPDANFLLAKVNDARGLYDALIKEQVIVRDRSRVKGCEGTLRITIGKPEENDRMLAIVNEWK